MVTVVGIMIAPVYGGWIFDTAESYSLAFLIGIITTSLAVVLVYLTPRPNS
jgi:MFS family permease